MRALIWGLLWLGLLPLAGQSRVEALVLARGGPEGVMAQAGWVFRDASREVYLPGLPRRYGEVGLRMAVNPAYGEAGVRLEASPHPMAAFRVDMDGFRYQGRQGTPLAFPDAKAPFGAEVLKARAGQPGWGTRLTGALTLQAPVGTVLLRGEGRWLRHHFGGLGPWAYEPELDTLVPVGGWIHHARLAALAGMSDWRLGPCVERTGIPGSGLGRTRIGVLATRERRLRSGGVWSEFLMSGVNLADPYRKGRAWILVGLAFRGG